MRKASAVARHPPGCCHQGVQAPLPGRGQAALLPAYTCKGHRQLSILNFNGTYNTWQDLHPEQL